MINSSTQADSMKNNGTLEKYCYNNDTANCTTYGGLYQWNEAMQYVTTPSAQEICPTSWHIPKLAEFQTLKAAVNNDGNSLKREDQGSGGGQGTNTSGFSALLAGTRKNDGSFGSLFGNGVFWSSTEYGTGYAYYLNLVSIYNLIDLGGAVGPGPNEGAGFSVRCVKD